MKMTMAVPNRYSVVIPLYNKQGTISRAIDSVMAQGHEVEVIVVDDGSTDEGPRLVERRASPSLRLVRQPNSGVSAARNKGIREASNGLVALLDADDEWLPGYLDVIDGLVDRYPEAGAYATSFQYKYADKVSPKKENSDLKHPYVGVPDFFKCVKEREFFCAGSVVLRKEVMTGIGGFNEDMWYSEDTDAWVRLALVAKFAYDSTVGMNYYQDVADQAMKLKRPVTKHLIDSVNEYARTHSEVDADLLSFANRHMCLVALRNVSNGYRQEARGLLSRRPSDKALVFVALCYLLSYMPLSFSSALNRMWNTMRTD